MKLSFMSFSCPESDVKEFIHTAKQYGFDGIEPRIDAGHKHGIEPGVSASFLQSVKEMAVDNGVKICCIATSCVFANPETLDKNFTQAQQALDIAAELDAPVIRVFGGQIPKEMSREESLDCVVEALTKLSDYAASRRVAMCVETHDDWCDPEWVAKIMQNVSNPYIAVNWDIMHPVLTAGYTMTNAFNVLKKWIKHVHIHDGIKSEKGLVLVPIGEGIIDHATALKLLCELNYDGYISGEWIGWEPYDIHLPRELAKLKSLI